MISPQCQQGGVVCCRVDRLADEGDREPTFHFGYLRHSPYEFMLDFIRLDFSGKQSPRRGVVVQRVNMSPQFVEQLISALSDNMSKFASNLAPSSLESLDEHDDGPS